MLTKPIRLNYNIVNFLSLFQIIFFAAMATVAVAHGHVAYSSQHISRHDGHPHVVHYKGHGHGHGHVDYHVSNSNYVFGVFVFLQLYLIYS